MFYLDINTNSKYQKIYEYKTISFTVLIDLILVLITVVLLPVNLDGEIDIPYYTIAFPLWIVWLSYFLVVGIYYLIRTPVNSVLLSLYIYYYYYCFNFFFFL